MPLGRLPSCRLPLGEAFSPEGSAPCVWRKLSWLAMLLIHVARGNREGCGVADGRCPARRSAAPRAGVARSRRISVFAEIPQLISCQNSVIMGRAAVPSEQSGRNGHARAWVRSQERLRQRVDWHTSNTTPRHSRTAATITHSLWKNLVRAATNPASPAQTTRSIREEMGPPKRFNMWTVSPQA